MDILDPESQKMENDSITVNRPRRSCAAKEIERVRKEKAREELCKMNQLFRQNEKELDSDDDDDFIEESPKKEPQKSTEPSIGKDMFSFASQSPSVKMTLLQNAKKTPTSKKSKAQPITPSTRMRKQLAEVATPHTVRKKIASKLGKLREETLRNQEYSDESDDDDDDDEEFLLDDVDDEENSSNYFSQNGRESKTRKTTNHTLSKLGSAMLTEEQIATCLASTKDNHVKHRRNLLKTLAQNFELWKLMTLEGSNLLLYGLGSKVELLKMFSDMLYDDDFIVLTVNGFLPTCTVQEIVMNIIDNVVDERPKGLVGIQNQIDFLVKKFNEPSAPHVYILINCIDAQPMTNGKTLQALEALAGARMIHFVGTVNHINAPLLWDLNRQRSMRWIWADATTYEPYTVELSSDSLKSSAANTLSSLEHVFASLTANAKKVFMLIANYTLERGSTSGFKGMPFHDCYRLCREGFIVNSDLTLRTQLTEFVDHDMIRIKKGHDGVEYLVIPVQRDTLEIFIQQQDDA